MADDQNRGNSESLSLLPYEMDIRAFARNCCLIIAVPWMLSGKLSEDGVSEAKPVLVTLVPVESSRSWLRLVYVGRMPVRPVTLAIGLSIDSLVRSHIVVDEDVALR